MPCTTSPAGRPWKSTLLTLLLPWVLCAAAQAQTMVSIDRSVVHLREGAGTQHDAVWKLSRGYPLKVIGKRGGWLRVRDFENDTGWVLARLTGRKAHRVVKVEVANLRSAAGTKARRIGQLHYGEVVRTLAHRPGWVRVKRHDGRIGWVARRLLWGW